MSELLHTVLDSDVGVGGLVAARRTIFHDDKTRATIIAIAHGRK